ncbi:MAG: hypothetical protein J7K48_03965 [Thermococcus sp.]|nr:hypothetical protein [Thermococcus sp.]
MLPPCIKRMLQNYKHEYAEIVAAYFKTHSKNADLAMGKLVREADNINVVRDVLDAFQNAPRFECELVKENYPDLCSPELCPLVSNHDPVEMAKNLVERVLYVGDSGELVIVFKGGKAQFVTDYHGAMRSPKRFASDFWAEVLLHFGIEVDLHPYKDPDTGDTINPAKEFLAWIARSAEQVVNYDTYGIGEKLLSILSHEPIYTESEARHNPDARVIIKEKAGKYYLYIDANYFRMHLRPNMGSDARSARQINAKLATKNIIYTSISVGGFKKPVYQISDEVFENFTGKRIGEFLGLKRMDIDELLAKVGFTDGGGDQNGS